MQTQDVIQFLVGFALLVSGVIYILHHNARRMERKRQEEQNQPPVLTSAPLEPPRQTFSAFELRPLRTYRVVSRFLDYDKVAHEVGERWTFLRKAFLPYEDGLSLFVMVSGREIHIRLQCREDEQGPIANSFSDFVSEE